MDWITITHGADGSNPVSYTVAANSSNTSRTGHINILDSNNLVAVHTIIQDGVITPGCLYTLLPESASIPAQGGSRSFSVTTEPVSGCPWTAISNVPWIRTISAGDGNGTATYTVDPNPGTAARTGIIAVANRTHTVTQEAPVSTKPNCYTLSPESLSVPARGGSRSFTVSVDPLGGCPPWSAVSNVPWIKTTASRDGNGTADYTVEPNDGASVRVGKITVGDQTHTVTQLACGFKLEPMMAFAGETNDLFMAFVGESRASFGFTVIPDEGCPHWTARTDNSDWITLKPENTMGDGRGTVIFTVEDNTTHAPRPGKISVGGSDYKIEQATSPPQGSCPSGTGGRPPRSISIGQVIYGALSFHSDVDQDCRVPGRTAFFRDLYMFEITENAGKQVAINVASFTDTLDPKVTLYKNTVDKKNEVDFDDDGAAFRNVRLPNLPAKDEFMPLEKGVYIIEVTSFSVSKTGNYSLLINPKSSDDEAELTPKILGAVIDGKTLIVTGEDFAKGAQLFIGDSTTPEKSTKNDKSRTRTALIALKSAGKVKGQCMALRVKNPTGQMSEVFVYRTCNQ
jgi:hypothetical protein